MGASKHAVPPVRFLLDVLEEVRRPEDAKQSRRPRGEDLPQSSKQCKLSQNLKQMGWRVGEMGESEEIRRSLKTCLKSPHLMKNKAL